MIGNQIAGFFSVGTPPAPASNYESIATVTVGSGGQSTITFSSIPSTYKHLQVRGSIRTTAGSNNWDCYIRLNSDSGTNYSLHNMFTDGSGSVPVGAQASTSAMTFDRAGVGDSNIFSAVVADFLDYANANKNKTMRALTGNDRNGNGLLAYNSGAWYSTSAVNTLTFTLASGNFAEYSKLALYGITGA